MSTRQTPVMITPVGYDTSYIDEQIAQLAEADSATRLFGKAVADLLLVYFLQGAHVRFADSLKAALDAWIAMRCCGTDRQIVRLQKQREDLVSSPFMYPRMNPEKTPEDRMIRLIEERDALISELEQAQRGIGQLPVEGMGDIFEASIVAPMRRNLEYKEQEICSLQEQLEDQRANAEKPAPTPEPKEERQTQSEAQ